MNTFKKCMLSIGLVFPVCSWAVMPIATEMPKDAWLEQIKMAVTTPVCKGFMEDKSIAAQMAARHVSYEQCITLITAIADTCGKKYQENLPATINPEQAKKWSRTIGECIGNDFAKNYLYSDSKPVEPEVVKKP